MELSSAAIFKRGGQKKELFGAPRPAATNDKIVDGEEGEEEEEDKDELGEDYDDEALVTLQELQEVLAAPRSGKDFSAAIWRPHLQAAEIVKSRKGTAQSSGFTWRRKQYLHIEEAAFYVDRGDLILFVEAQGLRLLSVQEAYDLMMTCGVTMERYLVYSHLMRAGYIVSRHPSRWTLEDEESPVHIWEIWKSGCRITSRSDPILNSQPVDNANAIIQRQSEQPSGSASTSAIAPPHQHGQGHHLEVDQHLSHRQWWRAVMSEHPLMQGIPEAWFEQSCTRNAVEDSIGVQIKRKFSRLKPLGPIPNGLHLGHPSSRSLLLYDVYKPGSKISRNKKQYPDVMHHLAICSGTPPSPQELRIADESAAATAMNRRVVWASVENTIISFFEIGKADLLHLF